LVTNGVVTNRDTWVYSFGTDGLLTRLEGFRSAYEACLGVERIIDATRLSWSRGLEARHKRGVSLPAISKENVRVAQYRPYCKRHLYYDPALNEVQYKTGLVFPRGTQNIGFVLPGTSSHSDFCILMTRDLPDLHLIDTGSLFARWRYEPEDAGVLALETGHEVVAGFRKIDNIEDLALRRFQTAYGESVTKEDIFFYVYGLLHSTAYRGTYAADLKKMLPRIPLVRHFSEFSAAGRALTDLHLDYERAALHPLDGLHPQQDGDPYEFYAVGGKKMSFGKASSEQKAAGERYDRSVIHYNDRITLRGVPEDAYRYMLGSRSAIEWIIDRYYVKTDKDSGIVNDPNDWSREVGDPRYILDLLARVVTVSIETMKIVDSLPPLDIIDA
jgi:predicted helicase